MIPIAPALNIGFFAIEGSSAFIKIVASPSCLSSRPTSASYAAAYDAEVGRDDRQEGEATILMNAEDPSIAKNPIFRAGAIGITVLVIVVLLVWMVMSGGQADRSGPSPSSVRATSSSAEGLRHSS